MKSYVLPFVGSDHWPIKLEWETAGRNLRRSFILEKFWLLQLEFQEKRKEWWEEIPISRGTKMYQFQQKLKILKSSIKKWNKETFGNIFQAKKELDCKIIEVQNQAMQFGFLLEIRGKERMLLQEFSQREQ